MGPVSSCVPAKPVMLAHLVQLPIRTKTWRRSLTAHLLADAEAMAAGSGLGGSKLLQTAKMTT